MNKIKVFGSFLVFVLVAWALPNVFSWTRLLAFLYMAIIAIVFVLLFTNSNRQQRNIKKHGFYVEVICPGLQRGDYDDEFGVDYYESDGILFFTGRWPSKSQAVLTIASPSEWEKQMPDWAKSRRTVILERIKKSHRFIVIQDDQFNETLN